jgi:hypothetical protein
MPTGYTAIIDDNPDVTFADYVWRCARAFGALVLMRDEPLDVPIPEFKVDEYYERRIRIAEQDLADARAMRVEQAAVMMREEHEAECQRCKEWQADTREKMVRYNEMYTQLAEWKPPTPDHAKLKEFMAEQLATGMPSLDWCRDPDPIMQTPEEWRAERVHRAEKELARAREALAEERKRIESRNAWVRALAESVPMPERLKP